MSRDEGDTATLMVVVLDLRPPPPEGQLAGFEHALPSWLEPAHRALAPGLWGQWNEALNQVAQVPKGCCPVLWLSGDQPSLWPLQALRQGARLNKQGQPSIRPKLARLVVIGQLDEARSGASKLAGQESTVQSARALWYQAKVWLKQAMGPCPSELAPFPLIGEKLSVRMVLLEDKGVPNQGTERKPVGTPNDPYAALEDELLEWASSPFAASESNTAGAVSEAAEGGGLTLDAELLHIRDDDSLTQQVQFAPRDEAQRAALEKHLPGAAYRAFLVCLTLAWREISKDALFDIDRNVGGGKASARCLYFGQFEAQGTIGTYLADYGEQLESLMAYQSQADEDSGTQKSGNGQPQGSQTGDAGEDAEEKKGHAAARQRWEKGRETLGGLPTRLRRWRSDSAQSFSIGLWLGNEAAEESAKAVTEEVPKSWGLWKEASAAFEPVRQQALPQALKALIEGAIKPTTEPSPAINDTNYPDAALQLATTVRANPPALPSRFRPWLKAALVFGVERLLRHSTMAALLLAGVAGGLAALSLGMSDSWQPSVWGQAGVMTAWLLTLTLACVALVWRRQNKIANVLNKTTGDAESRLKGAFPLAEAGSEKEFLEEKSKEQGEVGLFVALARKQQKAIKRDHQASGQEKAEAYLKVLKAEAKRIVNAQPALDKGGPTNFSDEDFKGVIKKALEKVPPLGLRRELELLLTPRILFEGDRWHEVKLENSDGPSNEAGYRLPYQGLKSLKRFSH